MNHSRDIQNVLQKQAVNLPGDHDETSFYACVNYTCGLNRYDERNKSYKQRSDETQNRAQ